MTEPRYEVTVMVVEPATGEIIASSEHDTDAPILGVVQASADVAADLRAKLA